MNKQEIIYQFMENNILISPELLNLLSLESVNNFSKFKKYNLLVLTKDSLNANDKQEVNWLELEKIKTFIEKGKKIDTYEKFINYIQKEKKKKEEVILPVNVLFSYKQKSKLRNVQHFVSYFNKRYKAIESILRNRQELQSVTSINRVSKKTERENVSLIGIIKNKELTRNGNLIITIEDLTGLIKILINKNRPELFKLSKDLVLDEIIGVVGVNGENIIYVNNILLPEIPLNRELKKCKEDVYAVFISDLHVGSTNFLPDKFDKFLKWINGETGSEIQKNIASKIKYLFIAGDLVDGVGIYPGQEEELIIKDIYKQYEECARLLSFIPKNIHIIICPGNHDAVRISEPQPVMGDFASSLKSLSNITFVSNPSLINIHASKDFSGFDVLLYHGYSFDYYVANVDSIRLNGGYNRADLIMKFLLQRRHLAPSHTSTLYIPDEEKDNLVIDKIPDFFISGHIHYSIISNYKNITTICCSCWQSKTGFQEKLGHNPQPARVPVVNLQTREVKILKF